MRIAVSVLFLLMGLFYIAYQRVKVRPGHSRILAVFLKCAATAMAAFAALLGCLQNGTASNWLLLAGLTVCTVADGVLNVHFLAGGAVFGLGHILYMISFCLARLPDMRGVILFLCLMGLATAGMTRFKRQLGKRAPFFYAYATLLSVMVAMAAAQPPFRFAGALLFAFSDALLAFLMIDRRHISLDYISLGAYYLGQFLLALSVTAG